MTGLFVLVGGVLAAALLSWWNWPVVSSVHRWTSDAKNISLFLKKHMDPHAWQKDFPFSEQRVVRFYHPLYLRLLAGLSDRSGSMAGAFAWAHGISTFIYVTGWMALVDALIGDKVAALLVLFVAVPFVLVISSDRIGVGTPGTWLAGDVSNALLPWFWVLAYYQLKVGGALVPLTGVNVLMFNLHPTGAIGVMPALGYLFVQAFRQGAGSVREAGISVALIGFGLLPAVMSYARHMAKAHPRHHPQISLLNRLAFERFAALWPYEAILPGRFQRYNRVYQVAVGVLVTGIYLVLGFSHVQGSPPGVFHAVLLVNLAVITFLHAKPAGTLGLVFCLAGLLGAFPLEQRYGAWCPALLMSAAIGLRAVGGVKALGAFLVVVLALLVSTLLPAWEVPPGTFVLAPFNDLLAIHVPLVFLLYFWGSWILMDVLPLRLGRPLMLIDWGRLVKTVQVPLYLYAALLIHRSLAAMVLASRWDHWLAPLVTLGLLVGVVGIDWRQRYGNRVTPTNELALFDWVRRMTGERAVFHVVSKDRWLAFNLRVNTLRSITGSWKDGGVTYYTDQGLFLEWRRRMDRVQDSIRTRDLGQMLKDTRAFGADYLVVDKHLVDGVSPPPVMAYVSDTYAVTPVAAPQPTRAPMELRQAAR